MNNDIIKIQQSLIKNLDRLDQAEENIVEEVARSNAISQLANTYIKSCNLIIRAEETKANVANKFDNVMCNEK